MKKLHKKTVLFMTLLRGSQENDTYSMPELCRKMGIPYEQIKRWARIDYRWADLLEICHTRCIGNIEMAAIMKRIPPIEAVKYLEAYEHRDDLIF